MTKCTLQVCHMRFCVLYVAAALDVRAGCAPQRGSQTSVGGMQGNGNRRLP